MKTKQCFYVEREKIHMKWLKKLLDKLFDRNKQNLLDSPKSADSIQSEKNIFISELKRQVNPEADERNGYKIAPQYRLKDGK